MEDFVHIMEDEVVHMYGKDVVSLFSHIHEILIYGNLPCTTRDESFEG